MLHFVKQVPFTAGVVETRDLNSVPALSPSGLPWGIRGILLHFRLVLVSAGTSDAVAQPGFLRLLSSLMLYDNLGKPWATEDGPVTGRFLRSIISFLNRSGYRDPVAIAANSNTTNTVDVPLYIPFALPQALDDETLCMPNALELKGGRIEIGYCASDEFGTGQVITQASSYCNVSLDLEPMRKLEAAPRLVYGLKTPDNYDRYAMPLYGKVLALGVIDPDKAPAIGATDFTNVEIRGQSIDCNTQALDELQMHYNHARALTGDADEADKALPSGGAAEEATLYVAPNRSRVAKVPTETEPIITLTRGAGAPATTAFRYGYVVIRAADQERFAEQVAAAKELDLTAAQVRKAFTEDPVAKADGHKVTRQDAPHVWPFLRKPVNLNKAGFRAA